MSNEDVATALNRQLDKFKEYVAEEFLERVKQKTPVVTGNLKEGWYYTETPQGFELNNFESYAIFVEMGTIHFAPRSMIQTTKLELPMIVDKAKQKAGLK